MMNGIVAPGAGYRRRRCCAFPSWTWPTTSNASRPSTTMPSHDLADGGVYEALVRHFAGYVLAFMARCTNPGLPAANHRVIAQFVAHGFAGPIKAWLSDSSLAKRDLVVAAAACAPAWWS